MPNWCEGSLGVRGTKENVLKFLKEGFERHTYNVKTRQNELVPGDIFTFDDEDDDFIEVHFKSKAATWVYIKGTTRAFFDEECGVEYMSVRTKDDITTCRIPIKQAWGYSEEDWLNIALQYDLDLILYGIECGMEFIQEFKIVRGKISAVTDDDRSTGNWLWDCPFPWLGG